MIQLNGEMIQLNGEACSTTARERCGSGPWPGASTDSTPPTKPSSAIRTTSKNLAQGSAFRLVLPVEKGALSSK